MNDICILVHMQPPLIVLEQPSIMPTPNGPKLVQVNMILSYPNGYYELVGSIVEKGYEQAAAPRS